LVDGENKLNRLFIDDIRSAPEGWHLARTITEAIRILSGPLPWDVVSLDHDILLRHDKIDDFAYAILRAAKKYGYAIHTEKAEKIAMSEETFATVARYIAAMSVERLPKIVYIHTANSAGARDIANILEGIVPTWDLENYDHNGLSDSYKEQLIKLEQEREKGELFPKFEGEF
jgi:hypothetical protein